MNRLALGALLLLGGLSFASAQEETVPAPARPEKPAGQEKPAESDKSAQQKGQDFELPAEGTVAVAEKVLVVSRGKDQLPLTVPVSERLVYDVVLDIALIGRTRVGTLLLSSGVEPFRAGLPKPGQVIEASSKRAGWVRANAKGGYLGYSLEHVIEARLLPQDWPNVIVRNVQSGSENRRHELMYGKRQGTPTLWYRRNRHCRGCERHEHFIEGGLTLSSPEHCKRCKRGEHRVWQSPELHSIPEGSVDMLSAIHLARTLVLSDQEAVTLPLLDKERWWDLTLAKGELATIKVPAGEFLARAIKLTPKPPEGEEREERFKGLFGIHGSLSVWLEERTGVPVQIEGLVPLGPLNLDISVELREALGVSEEFTPAK